MMKLLQHNRFGDPAVVLELVERPLPRPGPHQVVIRVEASAIHAGDLKNIAGERTMIRNVESGEVREIHDESDLTVQFPQTPGIEGVGRVIAAGDAVMELAEGDRVFLPFQCGSWCDHVLADTARLFRAPEGDPVQLALLVNAFTADFALRDLHPLQAGDWFVQNSANSNVGRALIALARHRGIRTANIVRRPELVEELRGLGADVVLVEGPGLVEELRAATSGAPLMIGLDGIAGDATGRLAECLSNGAKVANFGLMSGEPCKMPSWILHYKQVQLVGYYAGFNLLARTPEEQRSVLDELAGLIGRGVIKARIAATYALEQYREAVAHAGREGAEREGKIVFVPA